MNYLNTFIEVADDCKAITGTAPPQRAGGSTVAALEFELVFGHPYTYTQEDVQFHVYAQRAGLSAAVLRAKGAGLREAFFSKPMACMRTSALAKTYGWGLHFDARGLLALVPRDAPEYALLAGSADVAHTRAMRSKRAGHVRVATA
jgi:Family of unknown function (DUF6157)